jgi:hypothetical protein
LISFLDVGGIVNRQFVHPEHTVNQQLYLNVLKGQKYPEEWQRVVPPPPSICQTLLLTAFSFVPTDEAGFEREAFC